MKRSIVSFLVALVCTAGVRAESNDEEAVRRLAAWVAGTDHSIGALARAVDPVQIAEEPRELGNGLRKFEFEADGRGPFWFRAVTVGDDVVFLDGTFTRSDARERASIRRVWSEETGFALIEDEQALRLRHEVDRELLLRHLTARTGFDRSVNVPEDLREAYEMLAFPYDDLAVGTSCGIVGTPPRGRVQIDRLVRAGRYDLIANVLRGGNPEGRVYAVQALQRRTGHDRQTARMIQAVLDSPIKITHCSGCIVRPLTAGEILDPPPLLSSPPRIRIRGLP